MLKESVRKTFNKPLYIFHPFWIEGQAGDLITLPDSGTRSTNPSDFGSLFSETDATTGRSQDIPGLYKGNKNKRLVLLTAAFPHMNCAKVPKVGMNILWDLFPLPE